MTRILWIIATIAVALVAPLAPACSGTLAMAARSITVNAVPVYIQWLRVVPNHPGTLYVGGVLHCPDPLHGATCHPWMMRSTDGGTTWSDLSLRLAAGNSYALPTLSPLIMSPGGRRLYVNRVWRGGTPAGGADLLRSGDGGLNWASSGQTEPSGGGFTALALSPLSMQRLYAVHYAGAGKPGYVEHSDDGGQSWRAGTATSGPGSGYFYKPPWGGLVADPARLNTVYANVYSSAAAYLRGQPLTTVLRSDDAGLHWSQVITPTTAAPLHSFIASTGLHEGTRLVGRALDPGAPADRRYLSSDAGRTWISATCPGDLYGACPRFTLDNVFGAGASYGFLASGVYAFHGSGPATKRLAIVSSHLPLLVANLLDVEGGARAGNPVYLLGQGTRDNVRGLLYRSDDGGQSWQQLAPGVLPNLAPPSLAIDTLYVPATNHSVAAPFVDTYTRTSHYILGDPVTEAYTEGTTLRQDFDHMSLELRGGKVVAGRLGVEVSSNQFAAQPAPPLPADLRRFWQANGGATLLGAPLSPLVVGGNGDGSGRAYTMVWCQNARLERHPEIHDPHFSILLGLLGRDALRERGWIPSS